MTSANDMKIRSLEGCSQPCLIIVNRLIRSETNFE
jgi:hypothetical protein